MRIINYLFWQIWRK